MSASPRSKMPKTPSSPQAMIDDRSMEIQLRGFMDEWFLRLVDSTVAKDWERKKGLMLMFDIFEFFGCEFQHPFLKEKLLGQDEELMIENLVHVMNKEIRLKFDTVSQTLLENIESACKIRTAVDEKDVEQRGTELTDALESLGLGKTADEPSTSALHILRMAVIHSSEQAAKIRRCHGTWRANTEGRLVRLMRSAEEAEDAARRLLAVEAQLNEEGDNQKSQAKSVLMSLAEKNEKVLISSVFSGWMGLMYKSKEDNALRKKFQAELNDLQKQLYSYKERQLNNVRGVLVRQAASDDEGLLSLCIQTWGRRAAEQKQDGTSAAMLEEARERMKSMQEYAAENATKVLASMTSSNTEGFLHLVLQGWIQFSQDYKANKEMEDAVKATEAKLRAHMDGKKEETKKIMERMTASGDTGLVSLCITKWAEMIAEAKRAKELANKLNEQGERFSMMNERQRGTAQGVRTRINDQMNYFITIRAFHVWLLEVKVTGVDAHFTRKLESKRRQLTGVQNLFKTFAAQLEKGLGNDGGDSSNVNTGRDSVRDVKQHRSGKSKRHGDHRDSKGMTKGAEGAVSLPNIHGNHGRPVHA
eukprot:TRINITY_DN48829_c0_g1_i1.p1 TRINITY_DN48829_c0_g1~~TRINITY_DN48829_c0_g1_i1.p1  ORF type:complete len:617 (-),score=130.95 TRINITY_DN48829_c0_g1_i1:344-2107(-)